MSATTSIEWTDRTWNPLRGCSMARGSEAGGCLNCYAARGALRHAGPGRPYAGLAKMTPSGPRWTGRVELVEHALLEPLHWQTPARVFVNSMSDLFHESVPDEWIGAVFGVMAAARQHTFQVLTKRPARMRAWLTRFSPEDVREMTLRRAGRMIAGGWTWPLPHVWLGVSAEDQPTFDARVELLLETPAAVRFASLEPLLKALHPNRYVGRRRERIHMSADVEGMLANRAFDGLTDNGHPLTREQAEARLRALLAAGVKRIRVSDECVGFDDQAGCPGHPLPTLDWVIVGGESGPGARPCAEEWIREIVRLCQRNSTPVFVKQLGSYVVSEERAAATPEEMRDLLGPDAIWPDHRWLWRAGLRDRKGGDPSEWPEDLRVREFPRVETGRG